VGRASYYDPRINGHKTATGERFSSHQMTAAAKGIALGSNVVVTNLENGRSVQVRINDCGHFRHGSKVDLSKSAASKIGLIRDGTAPVKIAVVSAPPGAKTCDSGWPNELATANRRLSSAGLVVAWIAIHGAKCSLQAAPG
jgi:rare lipoprotein A